MLAEPKFVRLFLRHCALADDDDTDHDYLIRVHIYLSMLYGLKCALISGKGKFPHENICNGDD